MVTVSHNDDNRIHVILHKLQDRRLAAHWHADYAK